MDLPLSFTSIVSILLCIDAYDVVRNGLHLTFNVVAVIESCSLNILHLLYTISIFSSIE
jgi:hypothetical protein